MPVRMFGDWTAKTCEFMAKQQENQTKFAMGNYKNPASNAAKIRKVLDALQKWPKAPFVVKTYAVNLDHLTKNTPVYYSPEKKRRIKNGRRVRT